MCYPHKFCSCCECQHVITKMFGIGSYILDFNTLTSAHLLQCNHSIYFRYIIWWETLLFDNFLIIVCYQMFHIYYNAQLEMSTKIHCLKLLCDEMVTEWTILKNIKVHKLVEKCKSTLIKLLKSVKVHKLVFELVVTVIHVYLNMQS